ncbi:MAG: HNH endonuclease [Pseudomonadota bacterium]|nr:HNH endonuclease [Pseudomonadota bacterium]
MKNQPTEFSIRGIPSYIRREWKALLYRRSNVCALCDEYLDPQYTNQHPMQITLDHILPVKEGGRAILSNLQLAHFRCNTLRGSLSVKDARDMLTRRLGKG